MRKANVIKTEDLQGLQRDKNGNFIIPDGIEIYVQEDPEALRIKRINEIEAELKGIEKPSDDELICLGMSMHPYNILEEELKTLEG